MGNFFRLIGLVLSFYSVALAGNVLRVGPGGHPYTDIQSAILAANPGDLILIEPLSTPYGPIQIQKGVALMSSKGPQYPFLVQGQGPTPAVTIQGVPAGETTTLYDCIVPSPSTQSASILIQQNSGSIRLNHVAVLSPTAIMNGPNALIHVDQSQSVWFSDVYSQIFQQGSQNGTTLGVHGAVFSFSHVLIQSSHFKGSNNFGAGQKGGSGLVLDHSQIYIWSNLESSFIGGNGGDYGGNGMELIDTTHSNAMTCGAGGGSRLRYGTGTIARGRSYYVPGGAGGSGGSTWETFIVTCLLDSGIGGVEVPDRFSIGSTIQGQTWLTEPGAFQYTAFGFTQVTTPIYGRSMLTLDLQRPVFPIFQNTGGGNFSFSVPNMPSLVGLSLSAQSAFWVMGQVQFTEPKMMVLVP